MGRPAGLRSALGVGCLALCLLEPSACGLPGVGVEVELALPALPRAWEAAFGSVDGEVSRRDQAGEARLTLISPWREGPTGVGLELPAQAYSALLVTPVARSGAMRLKPAGAVFPLDAESAGGLISASWERGCAAMVLDLILERASRGSLQPRDLDVQTLCRLIERSGGSDPWRVDASLLLDSLDFPGGPACRILPALTVRIPEPELPGGAADTEVERLFVLDDPLYPPLAARGGGLDIPDLSAGFHRLFVSDPRTGPASSWLDIRVTAGEAAWIRREIEPTTSAPAP